MKFSGSVQNFNKNNSNQLFLDAGQCNHKYGHASQRL